MAGTKEKKKKQPQDRTARTAAKGKEEIKMIKGAEELAELPAVKEEKILKAGGRTAGFSKKEKRLDKKIMEKELKEIYKDQDGKIPDMSRIYHKKKSRLKRFMIGTVIFLVFAAGLSWAGFFFFGRQAFSGEKVSLKIAAPATVAGGEKVDYTIQYKNGEDVPLGQAELEVKLPENFSLSSADPASAERQNIWKIGSIAAGGSGEIKLSGSLYGALDSAETIEAILTYKPADFNSEFQKVATAVTEMQGSLLNVALTGPDRILANKETAFKINYKNTGSDPLQNIKISVVAPDDFAFKETKDGQVVTSWNVDELAPNDEKEIDFSGSFGSAAEGDREFKVQIGFVGGDNFYLQQENSFKASVLVGAILPTLILNGDSKDRTVGFGDTLNYSIVYQNKDKVDLQDLEIAMTFQSTSQNNKMILDWTALKDDANGTVVGTQLSPEIRQGTITWTKKQISGLAKLAPGAEETINFQIKVKPFSDFQDWTTKDFNVKSFVEVKIGKNGAGESETIDSNTINIQINSNLNFKTEARYFNDDNIAVGNGPLPPEVGKTTAYRIFWTVTNSLHEVDNMRVSTILPENINWSNKDEITAGNIKFDEATREISWTLNKIPTDVKSVGVNFEVTVTPVAADKGKLLTLLLSTNLQATDKSTGGTISKTNDALTSNLDGDPSAEGKGVVK